MSRTTLAAVLGALALAVVSFAGTSASSAEPPAAEVVVVPPPAAPKVLPTLPPDMGPPICC